MLEEFHEIGCMRKAMKRTIYVLFGILIVLWVVTLTPYEYLLKGVRATYMAGETSATIDDKQYFSTELIRSQAPRPWAEQLNAELAPSGFLDSLLKSTETVALAIFHQDKLVYEEYAESYSTTSRTNSFSMAKTVVAMLAQIAIDQGYFANWDQNVIDFLPELQGEYAGDLTLGHLSKMQGGLDWDEHYKNAFGITARAYYGADITKVMFRDVPISDMPGETYEYQSGSTQLLGECLEVATGRSLPELASEWIWTPAGCTDDAEWHVDGEGQAIAYCCINSNARDFARLGHILLHKGTWNNHLFMDSANVSDFFSPISTEFYGRSIWLNSIEGYSFSYFHGINGQFIIMVPDADLVIARLGHVRGPYADEKTRLPVLVDELVRFYLSKVEESEVAY